MKFLLTAALLLLSAPSFADLKMSGAHGFTVTHSIDTSADPFYAYRTMTSHVNQWWSADHTWSGVSRDFDFCVQGSRLTPLLHQSAQCSDWWQNTPLPSRSS